MKTMVVSACSWMTHLINGGVSKVDNEAMQLLKSILPDKIIARIQGVSCCQPGAAVALPYLGSIQRITSGRIQSALEVMPSHVLWLQNNSRARPDLSLQGQKFIADSHQRVTVMFSGEMFWGQCFMLLQHHSPRKPISWLCFSCAQ